MDISIGSESTGMSAEEAAIMSSFGISETSLCLKIGKTLLSLYSYKKAIEFYKESIEECTIAAAEVLSGGGSGAPLSAATGNVGEGFFVYNKILLLLRQFSCGDSP
jgi:hypothetical protein